MAIVLVGVHVALSVERSLEVRLVVLAANHWSGRLAAVGRLGPEGAPTSI